MIATALLGFAALFALTVRVTEPLAISPWESAIAMEAMRVGAGLPLYDASHATHLYGPLLTITLAGIFSITGLNLLAARVVFCLVGIALAILCASILCPESRRKYFALVLAMFLAIGWRTNFINFCAQPDAAAALLAVTAMVLWSNQGSRPRVVLSLVLYVAAIFFKQTAAAFALIPIAHSLFFERGSWARCLRACLPAAIVALSIATMWLIAPPMFHAMIVVPASLTIHWERALSSVLFVLGSFPALYLVLPAFLQRSADNSVERWSISAALVLVPLSIWTMLKSGGGYSSLFFGYLALVAVVSTRLEEVFGAKSTLSGVAVTITLLVSFFFQIEKTLPLLFARSADEHYADAVAVAQQLGPGVISPEDPSIAYRANGSFGPALFFELDTYSINGEWPAVLPPNIENALRSARYVVQAESYVPVPQFKTALVSDGFRKLDVPQLANSKYCLWRVKGRSTGTERVQ